MPDLSRPATPGLHVPYIKSRLPDWTQHLTRPHLESLTRARDPARLFAHSYPALYAQASATLRQALLDSQVQSNTSSQALAKTLKDFKGITEFVKPLLEEAMRKTFGQSPDVTGTMLFHLRAPNRADEQTLLQAALRNFEADEPFDEIALQETSALAPAGAMENELYDKTDRYPFGKTRYKIRDKLSIKPDAFASLCRKLDLGKQYQDHLSAVFDTPGTAAKVREQTITANKDRLRLQAHIARMKSNVSETAYAALLAILDGRSDPRIDGRPVAYSQLTVLGSMLSDVLIIGSATRKPPSVLEDIAEVFLPIPTFSLSVPSSTRIIVYIPGDPLYPVKEYSSLSSFATDFAIRLRSRSYQRFVAGLLPQDESSTIFRRLKSQLKVQRWNPNPVYPGPPYNPAAYRDGIYEEVWNENVNLALAETFIDTEVFGARYDAHLVRVKSNAKLLAIPTAEVDHKAWIERLEHYVEWGLNVLNVAAFIVPGLGEFMLAVTAVQLSYEVYEGVEAWNEGDAEEAWGHLKSVMENVAFMAALGAVASKAPPITASRFVDGMRPVTTPFGETRLWHPDLASYKSGVALEGLTPNALGQYEMGGKTYISLEGNAYEKTFDPALKQWRIKHPTDPDVYQPVLQHNNFGAWRHNLERPLEWDRLTLLRRMGYTTEALTDKQLLEAADISGVSDNALRKMHVDNLPAPPELTEALRLFAADPGVAPVIEQKSSAPFIDKLRRACPGLSDSAAQRVLLDANAEELTRLRTTHRIPLNMLEEARWYAQQGRQVRAFAGLYRDNMTSPDSQWLALHALEKLPGWSGEVRLEVRDGHINGPLIDGIGRETAASRKYVVKQGPAYQAFDERGEALNSVPRSGGNFFDSIMHALPDESRQALGVPHVGQSSGLQKAIFDSAVQHRAQLMQRLENRAGGRAVFKPPVRVNERQVGYPASGRGQGLNPSLVTRVQSLYPGLSDQNASSFILKQLRAGKSDAQIYGLLQERMREWEALESTLDQWVGTSEPDLQSVSGGKNAVARNLKECWRNSPLAEELPFYSSLDLICDDPIPPLSADFSHVRELSIRGRCITDANADALLANFPGLKNLRINATGGEFSNVPEALGAMQELTGLSLYSASPRAVDMPSRLGALTTLQELNVYFSDLTPMALDVSRLRNLRSLAISSRALREWPVGVLDLPALERLNLKDTGIGTLPDGAFQRHEKLWSGLSLDWSNFSREHFKPAFEYVTNHPEHLVDREEMVRDYCKGELSRLAAGMNESIDGLFNRFVEQWQGADARFEAVDALSETSGVLDRQLKDWSQRVMQTPGSINEIVGRTWATLSIKACWRNGAFKRYGATTDATLLDLPNLALSEFPDLPDAAFAHVQRLYLKGAKAPAEKVRGFVRGFTELQQLDVSGSGLTAVPIAAGDLVKLTRLDLSGNAIVGDLALGQGFDGLRKLEYLDLHNNPLNSLDVSHMPRLKALDLRATNLHEWPTGVQDLPELSWLDLRDSRISSLPATVLESEMLLKTDLTGTPLTPQAVILLDIARLQIELDRGLPVGTLGRFAREKVPSVFPPAESGFSITRHLLSLPEIPVGEGAAHLAKRLQRLKPMLAEDEALQVIEQLRESGATEVQISERIAGWDRTHDELTRRLNGWLFARESSGAGWVASSASRNQAALRILDCWRESLSAALGVADSVLNLNGLQLGDLPELPAVFDHVGTLNLTGTRLGEQGSNGFLQAFKQLRTLELNGNDLQAVPEPVGRMHALERLELSSNRLSDSDHLYASLNLLQRLQWLDLSYNALDEFDLGVFERLETLDLRNNNLTDWPVGVLDTSYLRTLNLSGNDITSIPPQALDGSHDVLMSGTDLSDNFNLSLEALEQMQDFRERGSRATVFGYSRAALDEWIDQARNEGEAVSESIESDEDLSGRELEVEQKTPWLANAPPEEVASKTRLWNQLAAEPDNAAFFHLLSRLQDTREFQVANADLTRRVWTVMEAAAGNTELRETLFASSNTHGTCVDGRILTFSALESTVYTHNALHEVSAGWPGAKGEALLRLSRRLFRLDKVDELATKTATRTGQDQAEVRLGYRIGLTGGWDDGLELPGQPKHMTFASGVTTRQLAEARREVMNAEHGDVFFEDLIQRDYWVNYLKDKYPEAFRALDEADLSQEQDDGMAVDDARLMEQLFDLTAARNAKMIELSRQEVEAIERTSGAAPLPGTSSR
ncbi:NEL-type E3 ubiquitin ligase domain-containing protein [Pseudomonas frederiksbergensis]|uniref:NEL-type E3 ubiquitin ligase domain-containing protein n=1 Tax=Pseudomonas frederiksbergensis TaxID=104087 RepID=UPI000F48E923|nr:NEL-type E3 ubiquitin ligase domain-containing protein [Pseudomonas frederiksbergensis]